MTLTGNASNGSKKRCSICGFAALQTGLFQKVAGQYVCKDMSRCENRRELARA